MFDTDCTPEGVEVYGAASVVDGVQRVVRSWGPEFNSLSIYIYNMQVMQMMLRCCSEDVAEMMEWREIDWVK
jgi:hypothetical protein